MRWGTVRRRGAFVVIEVMVVVAVIAVLLGLGYSIYRGARLSARVAQAESNLKQVASALDLFFLRYKTYPPEGASLCQALTPFATSPEVFENPLWEEQRPGQTLDALYHEPAPSQVDSPNFYVSALVSEDGSTAVILKTGGIVERRDGLRLPVDDLKQTATTLATNWGRYGPAPSGDVAGDAGGDTGGDTGGGTGGDTTPPPGDTGGDTGAGTGGDTGGATGGFDIGDDGSTVTKQCSDVFINALGSQFGYADGTMVDIAAAAKLGTGGWFALFGNQAIVGGETLKLSGVNAGTKVLIRAEILDPYTRWLWTKYGYSLSYASNDGKGQVVTLRNGDRPINNTPGFPYQVGVGSLLSAFVGSNGRIAIRDDQALYCFDFNPLGTTSTGIDYNDLVVLATAVAAEYPCEDNPGGVPGDAIQVDPVVAGLIKMNTGSSSYYTLKIVKPNGSTITNSNATTYLGPATLVEVKPYGSGTQTGLKVNGTTYSVSNGKKYQIKVQPGGYMTVYLYKNGSNWELSISATAATVTKLS
jgi:Tfp pilus assembly protein PilE